MPTTPLPKTPSYILHTLSQAGFEAYLVGGCVRDTLLTRTPKNFDICTSATPEEVKEVFAGKEIIEAGIKHGTVTLVLDDGQYEITTFRKDGDYEDNRHPMSVEFVTGEDGLREDLARRDFTINAMALGKEDELIDLFGGKDDLNKKLIRAVGNPDKRFNEDGLRILRALRFASTYNFSIEEVTAASIHKNKALLQNISSERIRDELCKLILGDGVERILLEYSDVISEIIPEIRPCIGFEQHSKWHKYDVYTHIVKAVSAYQKSGGKDLSIAIALLLHDIGKPSCFTMDEEGRGHFYGHAVVSFSMGKYIVKRLRFDNKAQNDICELISCHDSVIEPTPKVVRRILSKIGEEQFFRLIEVEKADNLAQADHVAPIRVPELESAKEIAKEIIREEQCFKVKDLDINGYGILHLDVPQGEVVGKVLNTLLSEVIDGALSNEREALLMRAKEIVAFDSQKITAASLYSKKGREKKHKI